MSEENTYVMPDKIRAHFLSEVNKFTETIRQHYEGAGITDLKVHINISESHDPKVSTMIIMGKTDKFHIENGKILDSGL